MYIVLVGIASAFLAGVGGAHASSMAIGGLTSQPIGHYEFCQANPAECSIATVDRGPVKVTRGLMELLRSTTLVVNRSVQPMSDIDAFGKNEVWNYPTTEVGDCEDYVLEKRRILHRAGIPLANLLITVVRKSDGEGHAVLTVRTNRGDYVLDNLRDDVRLWSTTNYRFLKRQASTHPGRWVVIVNDPVLPHTANVPSRSP